MMPLLTIDYQCAARSRWLGWALLGLGALLAADMALTQKALERQLAVWDNRTGIEAGSADRVSSRSDTSQGRSGTETKLEDAASVFQQLAMPWSQLFHSIEQAHTDQIALLSVQPDAQRRTVTIMGEAKEYNDVLAYVARLRGEAKLENVYLMGTELKEDDPQRPMMFTVSANWKSGQ